MVARTKTKVVEAEQDTESKPSTPAPPKPPAGIYPKNANLFMYTPESSGDPIWFPLEFEQPDIVWIWELYEKPFHVQSWEWLKHANVPREMQRKAVELLRSNPDEYLGLFNAWFKAMGGANAGE